MIFEMKARQKKMYEAMAEVQATYIATIQATSAGNVPPPRGSAVGALNTDVPTTAPEVMVERANAAMLKLNGILKSKEKKA
jgi:hypothetical protein